MNETVNRDLFITETIISYLQSLYPNEYSDEEIISRYKEFVKLKSLKKAAKDSKDVIFTQEDKNKLKELNQYFYGNSDGSRTGSGSSIVDNYIKAIENIKALINSNDNAIKDVVTNIYKIIELGDTTNKESFNKFMNEIVIAGLQAENGKVAEIDNITIANKVIKETIDKELYNKTIEKAELKKKEEDEKRKADIEKIKQEEKQKEEKTKQKNELKAQEQKQEKEKKDAEKKEKDKKEESKKK